MRITLYLLRLTAPTGPAVLHKPDNYREVGLIRNNQVSWQLFVGAGTQHEPGWVSVLAPIVDRDLLDDLKTMSSSAVLLLQHDGRTFALTFGHGFQAVSQRYIERGFGLRVTANVIAATKVTSADTRGMVRSGRNQKTMVPTAGDFYTLGIEPTEEWVRQLSGEVNEKTFAAAASGADSLQLTIKSFTLDSLPTKLPDIWRYYQADDYKAEFGFLDNFIRLNRSDPLIDELDQLVEQEILNRADSISFAAPDPFEQLAVDHYGIKYRVEVTLDGLGRDETMEAIHNLKHDQGFLKSIKVLAYDDGGDLIDKRYDLYDYVQAEIRKDDSRYVLTAGAWFRVSDGYVEHVHAYVAGIDDITTELDLPDWDAAALADDTSDKWPEGKYNKRTAAARGFAVLDKKNLTIGGPYQKIEICDLLSPARQLICVKQASQSSTLSHLFAQASVSASLMNEDAYRAKLMTSLNSLDGSAVYGNPGDWTFVYAIATDKPGLLAQSLFFFSQANLVTHAMDIRSRGFKVALARIAQT